MNEADLIREGIQHHQAGRFHQAEVCYRTVLAADKSSTDAWHLLGMIADAAGKSDDAIEYLRRALSLQSHRADILNNLGSIYEQRGEFDLAESYLRESVRLSPTYAIGHNNLGEVMKDFGRVRDAISCYHKALTYTPNFWQAGSNLLMGLNYDPDTELNEIFKAHHLWGNRMMQGRKASPIHANDRDRARPLRIGYVSPDFRQHAVARFFEPILAAHDQDKYQAILYSECPVVDAVSQRLRSLATAWRPTRGRSGLDVADAIRSDRIDILVDLAGHTRDNRLDVFVYKPAPIQVTYLGYPNTTGLECIDYRITDAVVDPPQQQAWATEAIARLKGHSHCFKPPDNAPDIAPTPSSRNRYITYGSHHPPIKMNDRVLGLWRRVLQAVPDSRLLLFRNSFNNAIQKELTRRFKSCAVPLERIEFRCPTDKAQSYLPLFNEIDLVLDSFPFTGHTMTCEALWMGVPVVTLRGDRPSSRLSASVLEALGLRDLVAETPEEYVAVATRWSRSTDGRIQLRQQLRELMRSRLCHGTAFTRRLEECYRWMWHQWCVPRAK